MSTRAATYAADNLDEKLSQAQLELWRTAEWTANQTLGLTYDLEPAVASALGVTLRDGQTYGTLEGLYSIINSEQVALAESTTAQTTVLPPTPRPNAKVGAPYYTKRDGGLYDIAALSRVALARCPTARCAIDLMGFLATSEGYYSATPEYAGETLLVADPKEAWSFHIAPLPPTVAQAAGVETDGGYSAVWVAQRVPDDHFTVVANRYTIRDVMEVLPDASTPLTLACRADDFRHSANLFAVAAHLYTLADDPQPLEFTSADMRGVRTSSSGGRRVVDFTATFAADMASMAYYTNGRVWRVLSLFVPDQEWAWPPPTPLATGVYPFSAKPSKLLTRDDFLAVIRDVYRGAGTHGSEPASATALDLTMGGLASGPHGDVSRYDVLPDVGAGGGFPRAISMFRTSYSHVTELGRKGGDAIGARIWAAQGAPHAAMYTPLHVLPASVAHAAASKQLAGMPRSLSSGSLLRADVFDPDPSASSVWWRSTMVNNWARAVGFDFAWAAIQAAQARVDAEGMAAAEAAEAKAAEAATLAEAAAVLAASDHDVAARSAARHRELITELMTSLHDGYRMDPSGPKLGLTKTFYPRWWLEQVGYYQEEIYRLPDERMQASFTLPSAGQMTSAITASSSPPIWALGVGAMGLFASGMLMGAVSSRRVHERRAAARAVPWPAPEWAGAVPLTDADDPDKHYHRIGA